MSARALMIMGTGSDVGKSLLVAGLCRAFKKRGIKVVPFKPQNMSNNAAIAADGGEIGRAQALQARAARLEPVTAMNPILLKPEHESGAQVIVRGNRVASMSAKEYFFSRHQFMGDVLGAFDELAEENDLILVEGAGSASEVNLRENDLANFGFARAMNVRIVLVGDIQRGGVIASLVGTFEVIESEDRELIVACLINKFQGDPVLFEKGAEFIATHCAVPVLGPVPFFDEAHRLPAEDVLALDSPVRKKGGRFRICVPRLSRIANFDDFDPLRAEPDVSLNIINPGEVIPKDSDLIIIPGSKATCADMQFMREQGWGADIIAHVRQGGAVLGICGGYQMLGRSISDPKGIEGEAQTVEGLSLLNIETVLSEQKELGRVRGKDIISGEDVHGFHMHMGVSDGPDRAHAIFNINGENEGARSVDGRVTGTYLHGIFSSDGFRRDFLTRLGANADGSLEFEASIDDVLDRLAEHLEKYLDLDEIYQLAKAADFSPVKG